MLEVSDLFLLDIKHIDEEKHKQLTGHSSRNPKDFAYYLSEHHKPVWIRHVLMSMTNDEAYLRETRRFIETLNNVEKIEVLPYHSMGTVKYQKMGLAYPLENEVSPLKEETAKALVRQFLDTIFTSRELLVSLIERVELTEEKELILQFRFRKLEALS